MDQIGCYNTMMKFKRLKRPGFIGTAEKNEANGLVPSSRLRPFRGAQWAEVSGPD